MTSGVFYTQTIYVSLGVIVVFLWFKRSCNENIKQIDTDTSRDWYLIQGFTWEDKIRNSVEQFMNVINGLIDNADSEDKYGEIFLDSSLRDNIKDELKNIYESYDQYVKLDGVLSNFIRESKILIGRYERMMIGVFPYTLWSLIGLNFDTLISSNVQYLTIYWGFIMVWIFITLIIFLDMLLQHKKCNSIDSIIRIEKSKYQKIIEKAV